MSSLSSATSHTSKELLTLAAMGASGAFMGALEATLSGLDATNMSFEAARRFVALQLAALLGPDSGLKPEGLDRLERQLADCVAEVAQGVARATTSVPRGVHQGLDLGRAIIDSKRRAAAETQFTNGTTHNPLHRVAVGIDGIFAQLRDFKERITASAKQ